MEVSSVGSRPDALSFSFCCRTLVVAEGLVMCFRYPAGQRIAKRNARGKEDMPCGLPPHDDRRGSASCGGAVPTTANVLRTRQKTSRFRRHRFGRPPHFRQLARRAGWAASAFSLTPSKGAFSFRRRRKENGGFEACGLRRTSPRPGTGRTTRPPRRGKLRYSQIANNLSTDAKALRYQGRLFHSLRVYSRLSAMM